MKKQFYSFALLFAIIFQIYAFAEFDVLKLFKGLESKPISYDLTGIVNSGTTILLWGNVSELMSSTDKGNTWQRVYVSDKIIDYPIGIEYLKNKFVGVLSDGSGIISLDDGKTWQKINIYETNRIFKMLTYQDKIFYMTSGEFKIYDENFQKIKTIKYQIDTSHYDFVVSNNRIIYPIGNGKIGMINLNNEQTTVLNLDSLKICQTCTLPTNFLADNDYFYFFLDNSFYRYNFLNGEINIFAKPSNFKNSVFTLNNGKIYQVFSKNLGNSDSLFFYQLINDIKGGDRINATGFDRRVRSSVFKSVKFINNSTIIAVGSNKLICITYDGGKNWKILSVFNPTPPINNGNLFIFDTLNLRFIDNFFNYYYTTNGGVTWLSTSRCPEEMFSVFSNVPRFHFFFNTDTGISVASKNLTPQKNICYTFNRGENLSVFNDTLFNYLYDEYYTLPLNDKLLVFTNNGVVNYGTWFIVWEFNKDLKIVKDTFKLFRKIFYPFFIDNMIIGFSIANPPKELIKNKSFWIIKSYDKGLTWDSIPILQNYWFLPDTISLSLLYAWQAKDNIYYWFSYSASGGSRSNLLFKFDPFENTLNLIDSTNEVLQPLSTLEINNKFFLNLIKPLFTNKDIKILCKLYVFDNPTSFNIVDLSADRINPRYFIRSIVKPNLIVASFFDSLSKSGFFLLMNDKELNVVEDEREFRKPLDFSHTYPQPAKVRVKARVAWDGSFDLREAIDGVYDSMGRKVEGKERIRVDARNTTSGELEWECSGVPAGIYFILIRWQGGSDTVPVVVE